jgi:hypothetical protein
VVLEPLTPEEQARHEKGIERVRGRLFRRYQPSDYFIIPNSERVIAASAESCWNAACGRYRVFHFGGLSYLVDGGDKAGVSKLTISRVDSDGFDFWLSAAQGHTVTSVRVRFRELDEVIHAYVCSYWRANLSPVYVGLKPM